MSSTTFCVVSDHTYIEININTVSFNHNRIIQRAQQYTLEGSDSLPLRKILWAMHSRSSTNLPVLLIAV